MDLLGDGWFRGLKAATLNWSHEGCRLGELDKMHLAKQLWSNARESLPS